MESSNREKGESRRQGIKHLGRTLTYFRDFIFLKFVSFIRFTEEDTSKNTRTTNLRMEKM